MASALRYSYLFFCLSRLKYHRPWEPYGTWKYWFTELAKVVRDANWKIHETGFTDDDPVIRNIFMEALKNGKSKERQITDGGEFKC